VMLNLQPLRKISDAGAYTFGQPLQREQELVLARLQPGRPRRFFAEVKKAPDLVSQLRQGLIIGDGKRTFHSADYTVMSRAFQGSGQATRLKILGFQVAGFENRATEVFHSEI
jgi:hypothetical protein